MKWNNKLFSVASLLIILLFPGLTIANDGDFDANNDFPAIGRIASVVTIFGEINSIVRKSPWASR
jgi:hypothetical protein